jgi:hypothetical protein
MTHNQATLPSSPLKIGILIIMLFMGLAMIGGAWWISKPLPPTEIQIRAQKDAEKAREIEALRQRRLLLSRQLQYLVDTEEAANRVAILRASDNLDDAFNIFSNKIPSFAEEVTSWKARYKIARSRIKDKINGTHEFEILAAEYFEKNVASNQDISSAVDKIAAQFQSDLVANRNRMLSETVMRIREADLGIPSSSFSIEAINAQIAAKRSQTTTSLSKVPTVTALSVVGSITVEMAIQAMVTRAVGYAAGAASAGAAAGTASGTVITPGVCTAIGLVVGVTAGFAVDYIMNERMKTKIMQETRDTLYLIKDEIWANSTEGLNVKMSNFVVQGKALHTAALVAIAQEGNP